MLSSLGQYQKVIAHHDEAIQLQQNYLLMLLEQRNALHELGRYTPFKNH